MIEKYEEIKFASPIQSTLQSTLQKNFEFKLRKTDNNQREDD
jgi:hypothetical protein